MKKTQIFNACVLGLSLLFGSATNVFSQIPDYIPRQGLAGWYPFNGNANDESGHNLNGSVNGAKLTTDRFGKTNSAYSFTTNQDITISNSQNLNFYPLTISLWYSVDSLKSGENGNLFSKYVPASWNGFQVLAGDFRNVSNADSTFNNGFGVAAWYLRNTANRLIGYYGEKPFLQQNISFKAWYHYVFVVDGTGGKIFVNGQLVDSHKWTGTPGASCNSFLWKIGGLYNNWFHGKIDDVAIWNKTLTEQEVQQLYNNNYCNTSAPTGNPTQSFAYGARISELKVTGSNILWYSTPSGGTPLAETTSLMNGSTYYASQTLNACESLNRLAVKVTLINNNQKTISFDDQSGKTGSLIDISINTSLLTSNDGIISYQFTFNFDDKKLLYIDRSLAGTIAEGGNIFVNASGNGTLKISYMNLNKIAGNGAILKLTFRLLSPGATFPEIRDFLYNSEHITSINNGSITALLKYGDIDDNGLVQAFDAALALQHSAGYDPLPLIDALPWEPWRFTTADVDGSGNITAYDAALILQYSVGLLNVFPVEEMKKSSTFNNADIKISIINNDLYFSATGDLFGLNLSCLDCSEIIGQPTILNPDFISSINITDDIYKLALATAIPPNTNETFMKIPIQKDGILTFDLVINNEVRAYTVNVTKTIEREIQRDNVYIYPNPAKANLHFSFHENAIQKGHTLRIINTLGMEVYSTSINQQRYVLDISKWETKGLYMVSIMDNSGKILEYRKIVIQ